MQLWRQATLEAMFTGMWVYGGILIGSGTVLWGTELPGRTTLVAAFLNTVMFVIYIQVAMATTASEELELEQQATFPDLNPAITLLQVLRGAKGPAGGLLFIIAQCAGAILAALSVKELLPQDRIDRFLLGGCYARRTISLPDVKSITVGLSDCKLFLAELAISFTFLYVTTLVTRPMQLRALGLKCAAIFVAANIGFDVYLSRAMGLEYSGSNFNPARCLGPAVAYGQPLWDRLWPPFFAPFAAAFPAALILAMVPPDDEDDEVYTQEKKKKNDVISIWNRWSFCRTRRTGDFQSDECTSSQVDDSELKMDIV